MRKLNVAARCAALMLALCGGAQLGQAAIFNYFEDFSKFGQQPNFTCPAPSPGANGVCAAIAAINSFAFLQNSFPQIYGTRLLPNYDKTTKTDMTDANAFALGSWPEPAFAHTDDTPAADLDTGYYARCNAAGCVGGPNQAYMDTKMDWISDHVPGVSTFFAMYLTPTIDQLANEIKNQEDVEFFIKDKVTPAEERLEGETDEGPHGTPPNTTPEPPEEGEEVYHALTLTAIKCELDSSTPPKTVCSIKYQDPNPAHVAGELAATLTETGGRLEFDHPDFGTVFIDAAFSESAVPEPSSLLLFAAGFGCLAAGAWRKRGRRA